MIFSRFEELCAKKATTPTAVCKHITKSSGNLATWKNGNVRNDHLKALADYFDVSVDYLLGRTNDPSPYSKQELNIPPDIANVQFAFHEGDKDELTQEDIDDIAKYVRYMREKRRKENESKK